MSPTTLQRRLRRLGVDDVVVDAASTVAHSSDASLYRVRPLAVVRPRSADQVREVVAFAQRSDLPLTARGGGTSIAGNAIGPGLVLDFSRHMGRVLAIDPERATARVQPGVVQAVLQQAAAPHGLRFGPDPSTHTRCTIGGMIGNDACGARSLGFGRTSHNVAGLTLIAGTGDVVRTEATAPPATQGFDDGVRRLRALVADDLPALRTELGRFDRQISGYALHHLLPEHGFNLTRALVGSEGTLGVITEATVRLVPTAPHKVLVALGYASMIDAATDVPHLLEFSPTACEGLDARIVDVVRGRRGPAAVPDLPAGRAWLFTEVDGPDAAEVLARARELARSSGADDTRIVTDLAQASAIWRIREDGAGLSGRAPSGHPAHAGWEDAAVPPDRLAAYLTDFEALTSEFGLTCMPYGHFGEGCIHVRLDFPFHRPDGPQVFRAFVERSADLVARHGGSLSGEHGDGRARGELLPRMYSPAVLALFKAVKGIFDPQGILNPGVMIAPDALDDGLRVSAARPLPASFAMAFERDHGDLSQAVHRCTGVGRCRAVDQGPGRVMCPSYDATREEIHSTRGRARVLQDLLEGRLEGGWRDPAVRAALDLCLSCKGCASDCPTGVDIGAYKAEVTHQAYRHRLRPRSHYSLGWLPRWTRLAGHAPALANGLLAAPGIRRGLLHVAGVDGRRRIPRFAQQTFRAATAAGPPAPPGGRPVVVFLDSFTDAFAPQVAHDLLRVLSDAGYSPTVTGPDVCCGLTWISTGQLDAARRILSRTVSQLVAPAREGVPIVGIEPSCTAVLRSDATELLDTSDARAVAGATRTLAELLADTPTWEPPRLTGTSVVAQPHCHHHSVMGWDADRDLLVRAGAQLHAVGGCCGLAGNFGLERGHYDVSVAIAEQQLIPALDGGPTATVLADGFSCRTQIADLTSRPALHLAELLAGAGGTVTTDRASPGRAGSR